MSSKSTEAPRAPRPYETAGALALVVAGLATVALLIYGLMARGDNPSADAWALLGLAAYVVVWILGMIMAKKS